MTTTTTSTDERTEGTGTAPAAPAPEGSPLDGMKSLLLDVGLPLGGYYLLHKVFGVGVVPALVISSIPPAVSTVVTALRKRRFNGLAGLILVVNLAGIALNFLTGDPRLMIAKDSVGSGVIGLGILLSAWRGKPLMTAGLKPMVVKKDAAKSAAWDRLSASSRRFRRAEQRFTAVWGAVFLAESAARVIGAYTLPVTTMVWLSSTLLFAAIALACLVAGPVSVPTMERLLARETSA
ncbi:MULTISPECIES: VC0807 family protein [Streptomycetaceae]|uniref:Uncharacterized protein n=1 Tax=Streptantibioticus cattleyicolor (strain ATCC 35852 / DSM 46488 / JCM 4925 / NBRC 14057 / NRRL 8057) TaxID=1003195 RepID=F8K4N8_STREN|nr:MULTISPECIES: VC0807 family protein [Streptomycetaceae]AEW96394.1 hypothetical protein SCATT_40230 [Streptantibioticus cattleyicolor NRRL 8057 = DSM 46488]MYS60906.1 hypothetical protein [Streptomyces sp. SID5468]CCB76733.1 putative membrane protein [Streptantibioticus cattleyicolor NRRL 8057 = DSM 46488]